MKQLLRLTILIAGFFCTLAANTAKAQVILTMDSIYCGSLTTTLHAYVAGDTPLSSGIVEDDIYAPTPYALGFTFNFYGTPYTECLIGANGNLCFDYSLAGAYDPWPISAPLLGNTSVLNSICGPWCDIYVPAYGIITYSAEGVAPHRRFVVNFCKCAMFSCTTQWITTQMVLNETTDIVDVYVAHKTFCTSWNGGYAIIGVQNSAGTDAVTAPGRDYPATYNCTDEAWQFTPISGGATYSVTPITFSPVPYGASMIYWYDSTTGAFIDSGTALTVSATVAKTYQCVALGCGDSSFAYIHVAPAGAGISLYSFFGGGSDVSSYTNPTSCGLADGTITLKGHGMTPGLVDTVTYDYNGVPQAPRYLTVTSDSSVTLVGLCAGTYSLLRVAQNACPSAPLAPLTLSDPVITITSVSVINPAQCGATGSLVLNGLYPGKSFTVNYDYNGVAQPPVVQTSSGSGTITLAGLCPGAYTNITASFTGCDVCTTPATTVPYIISSPGTSISGVSVTQPSGCGIHDGVIALSGLYPYQTYTVRFDTGGVQASFTLTANGAGALVITGLSGGNTSGQSIVYSSIYAFFVGCDSCITNIVGPETLSVPLIPMAVTGSVNPSQCGYCDGSVTLSSAGAFTPDTIFYSLNGVVQTPVSTYTNRDGTITMPGLCSGPYSNFTVKVGPCVEPAVGSANLINPQLFAGITDAIRLGCHGDTVLFTNTSSFPNAVIPAVANYSWNFGDLTSVDTFTNPEHIYMTQGVYTVTLTVSNDKCVDDTSVTVSLVHPLHAGFSYTPAPAVLCQENTVAFTDTSSGNIIGYNWLFGNGATASSINASYTYKNAGTYNAMLIVTDIVPCSDTAAVTIQVDSQSSMAIEITDSVICRGTDINFTGIYTTSGLNSITWNFGDGDSIINANPALRSYDVTGTFSVTASAYYRACNNVSATRVITVLPQPELNLGFADTSICAGSNALVLADRVNAGNPAAKWTWSTGQTGPQIAVTQAGTYTATVSVGGCKSAFTVNVRNDCYLDIPNAFSPNGDGVNDFFLPRAQLASGLTSFSMNIYNRWGELIFTTNSVNGQGWDGKLNATDQPEGVYVYIVDATFKDGEHEHHQGNVTLIR